MNNAPYHINTHNKPPVQSANKQAMEDGLKLSGLSDEMSIRKTILFDNNEHGESVPGQKLFNAHGHTVNQDSSVCIAIGYGLASWG
jgi:hypothetical protein